MRRTNSRLRLNPSYACKHIPIGAGTLRAIGRGPVPYGREWTLSAQRPDPSIGSVSPNAQEVLGVIH